MAQLELLCMLHAMLQYKMYDFTSTGVHVIVVLSLLQVILEMECYRSLFF